MSRLVTTAWALVLLMVPVTAVTANTNIIPGNFQTNVSGTVVSASDDEPLPGVNVTVKGKIIGTSTDASGSFELTVNQDPPLTLVFSMVGYQTQEIEITSRNQTGLQVALQRQAIIGSDVVVSASRVEESILEAPVTIEKMDVLTIRNTPSDDYYKALSHLKGVDMTASSINFQIINSRGFNSTGNTRMVQLIDGMDTQAPALNFPIGNLNGPSELDVESMEYLPGASSALYGPNAFNGILLINSKNPFRYQGLSAMVKTGINHLDGDEPAGEPGNPQPMYNAAVRYAKAFNDRLAFKVNFAYSKAEDWRGISFEDKNTALKGELEANPAYDGIHLYGDDGSFNIGLLGINPATRQQIATIVAAQSPPGITAAVVEPYVGAIPSQPVTRTGYAEHTLVDYGAENMKVNGSLHYRLTDLVEASYSFNYGYGTSIYTGAQRYSLNNFSISQHKLQLQGDNFTLKGYGTFENSGDSYIADFVGYSVNNTYLPNELWFGTYGAVFAGGLLQAATQAQGGNPAFNPATVQAILNNPALVSQFHAAARAQADAGRLTPGSAEFENAKNAALENTIPDGALFDDNSRFYHVEGLYDFKNEIDIIGLQAGASFRQFQLRSNGTIFDDEDGVNINEWGAFLQASKALADDRLNLTGSIRYDKNENFDGQFSPRLSAVVSPAENHNFRASFQTGFRNPTTQGQYIDLNVVTARLLGGLPRFNEMYSLTENAYTIESVQAFTNQFLEDPTDPATAVGLLEPYTEFDPVKPEQVQAFEVGYKGLIGGKLFIDAAYYYNIYDDFITQITIRKAAGPFTGNPASDQAVAASLLSGDFNNTYQFYTNTSSTVEAHGAVFGVDYSLPGGYLIGANYNWNKLIGGLEDQFLNDFNTPEHKVNISFGNRNLTDNLGFNIAWRWQDAFRWESTFVQADVDAVSTFDAQVNYLIPQYNATLKVGGSNLFNTRYTLSGGGPNIGAIYYVSLTFDQLFR